MKNAVNLKDIRNAREKLGNIAKRTPLVRSEFLSSFFLLAHIL